MRHGILLSVVMPVYNAAASLAILLPPCLQLQAAVVYGSERRVLLFWHSVGTLLLALLSNTFTDLNLRDMETG